MWIQIWKDKKEKLPIVGKSNHQMLHFWGGEKTSKNRRLGGGKRAYWGQRGPYLCRQYMTECLFVRYFYMCHENIDSFDWMLHLLI